MRVLRRVSQLLVMFAICACARASTLVYDFHLNAQSDSEGTFAAADIFYTSSDNHTFTYLSGSIDGFVPAQFNGGSPDGTGSDWVYTGITTSVPIGSIDILWFVFMGEPSGPGVYTSTAAWRSTALPPGVVGQYDNVGGSLTITDPSAPTPEPATVMLLGTGLAGMTGIMKRRWRK